MKQYRRWLIFGILGIVVLVGLGLLWIQLDCGIAPPQDPPQPTLETMDLRAQKESIEQTLREAPWQGLRFLPQEQEWRFYGWTAETRRVQLNGTFDLIKVYYLQAGGDLAFTWAATGIEVPGQGYQSAALSAVRPGQVVALRLFGKHVGLWGVDWSACDSEYCRLANTVDTLLILDDQGTGLSNGFIRYGWEPPAYPLYGFLCWSIEPWNEPPAQVSARP